MITLEQINPALGLSITCGDLELRTLRDDDLPALTDVILDGVRDEGISPFIQDWDLLTPAEIPVNSARFWWGQRAAMSPSNWRVFFVVRRAGEIAGTQDVHGKSFAQTKSLTTGSWLGRRFQSQGIGTQMRAMACCWGFDALGAEEMVSSAFVDNPKSLGVSRNVGYEATYTRRLPRGEGWQTETRLRLTPERFRRPLEPVRFGGVAAFRRQIGLDA